MRESDYMDTEANMQLKKLYQRYENAEISKHEYWKKAREYTKYLWDFMSVIKQSREVEFIKITGNDVIIHTNEGELYFTFDDLPICRAESVLLGTEQENFSLFRVFIPSNGTVLDIGANVGRVSLAISHYCPDAKIYSFEPVPATYDKLKRNIELNGKETNIFPYNIGFSNERGEMILYVSPASEASSMRPLEDAYYVHIGAEHDRDGQTEVKCYIDTLDYFVQENNMESVDFVKVDAEGAEKLIFEGGEKFFTKQKPVVYTEMLRKHSARFGYHPNEIIDMFASWGYRCYRENDGCLLPFLAMDKNTAETNFFFLHNVKHREFINKMAGK